MKLFLIILFTLLVVFVVPISWIVIAILVALLIKALN